MGSIVADASVLIAFLNPDDSHHSAAVRALRDARDESNQLVLPATALAEILVEASRIGPAAAKKTESFIDEVIDVVYTIDRAVARAAARLRAQHRSLRLPDALVLATGGVIDADAILTADRKWLTVDPSVRLVSAERLRERPTKYRRK